MLLHPRPGGVSPGIQPSRARSWLAAALCLAFGRKAAACLYGSCTAGPSISTNRASMPRTTNTVSVWSRWDSRLRARSRKEQRNTTYCTALRLTSRTGAAIDARWADWKSTRCEPRVGFAGRPWNWSGPPAGSRGVCCEGRVRMIRSWMKTEVARVMSKTGLDRWAGSLSGAKRVPLVINYHGWSRILRERRDLYSIPVVSRRTLERHLDWIGPAFPICLSGRSGRTARRE